MSSEPRSRPPHQRPAADEDPHGDRDVDEEDPSPAGVLGQRAAEQQAQHGSDPGHRPVHAERLGARPGRPGRWWPATRGHREQRSPRRSPWTRRAMTQHRPVRGQPRRPGGHREDDDPEAEHAQATEEIAGPAAGEQQPTEGQRVEAGDPVEVRRGNVQRPLHARQRHVDDGVVEDQHELCRRDDQQRQAQLAFPSQCGAALAGRERFVDCHGAPSSVLSDASGRLLARAVPVLHRVAPSTLLPVGGRK